MAQSSWRWPFGSRQQLKQRLQDRLTQVSDAVESLRHRATSNSGTPVSAGVSPVTGGSSKRLSGTVEGSASGVLLDGVSELASRLGFPLNNLPAAPLKRLRELRPGQLSRGAGLVTEVMGRHFPTAQTLLPLLPSLLMHLDDQVLPYFQASLMAVLHQDPDSGPLFTRTLVEQLEPLPPELQRSYLARVLRGAYLDVGLAMVLAEELPGLMKRLPDEALDVFLRQGFGLWRESSDKASSFFRLESRQAAAVVASLRHSLNLNTVKRTLQLYAQAHGGPELRIRGLDELPDELKPSSRTTAFTDGRNIYLPEEMGSYGTQEENFRLYKAMTAIEVGRIEFGTFAFGQHEPPPESPPPSTRAARLKVDEPGPPRGAQRLLQALQSLPEPAVGRTLFQLLETHRVEQRILTEYPGLRADLQRLTAEGAMERPTPMELEPLAAVLEALAWQLWGRPLPEGVSPAALLPEALRPVLQTLSTLVGPLSEPGATVELSLDITKRGLRELAGVGLIVLPEDDAPAAGGGHEASDPGEEGAEGAGEGREAGEGADEQDDDPSASEQDSSPSSNPERLPGGEASAPGGKVRTRDAGNRRGTGGNVVQELAFEPLPHQGHMMLELAAELEEETARAMAEAADALARELSPDTNGPEGDAFGGELPGEGASADSPTPAQAPETDAAGRPSPAELRAQRAMSRPRPPSAQPRMVSYPEWDWQIQDYKERWTQVFEEGLPETSEQFAEETLLTHGALVKRLRRQFQRLKREEFEKFRRQLDGDEVDVDAAVEALIERHAGHPPPERLYVQRRKQGRDVAVAFLVDMSSSTQQVVQSSGRTILDIEKESLLLMSEALESLGDSYAIYGFSGYGRGRVSFYVAKEFEDRFSSGTKRRISAMSGRLENRDGAAIRHAVQKLLAWPARVRLLILLSDGRPLDCGCRQYFERYAQEDTRMALREAQQAQIHPFCITVDRQAQRYLSQMYGQVQYTIIDQVSALPHRLPLIYRRLTT